MNRLLVFALVGPPLGLAIGLGVLVPALNVAFGDPPQWDWRQIVLIPLAYMVGLAPALAAGIFDEALARRKTKRRPFWTGAFAFAMSFLPSAAAIVSGMAHGPFLLIFGLVGALPGAICSLLADVVAPRNPPEPAD
jgi:hypothetical protein